MQKKLYKGKDEDKPKKPQSSYFCFLAGFRAKNKDKLDHKEMLRKGVLAMQEVARMSYTF